MSRLYLTLTSDTLGQAISDLAAKSQSLSIGEKEAPRHFEDLIGPVGSAEISIEEKISHLDAVREELEGVLHGAGTAAQPLSEAAIIVLSGYEETQARPRLDVEHVRFGRGIPSARLCWAAAVARGKLTLVLQAVAEDLDPPETTFQSYFEAYEEEIGTDAFEDEDDLWFISTSIAYLDALVENTDLAWTEGIDIPEVLLAHVLEPYLEKAKLAVRLH